MYVCRSADEDSGEDPGINRNYTGDGSRTADTGRSSACLSGFLRELDLMGHNLIFDYSFLKHQAADQKIPFEKMELIL